MPETVKIAPIMKQSKAITMVAAPGKVLTLTALGSFMNHLAMSIEILSKIIPTTMRIIDPTIDPIKCISLSSNDELSGEMQSISPDKINLLTCI